jgi:threonine aldolase
LPLAFPREANALFIHLPNEIAHRLQERGWQFYKFFQSDLYRLMCSWATTAGDVEAFAADL